MAKMLATVDVKDCWCPHCWDNRLVRRRARARDKRQARREVQEQRS